MQADLIPESFFQALYPESSLPPLWEVIYQESMRGHHLLFKRTDVDLFETLSDTDDSWLEERLEGELERLVLKLLSKNELGDMVKLIDGEPEAMRRRLFAFYKRSIMLWNQYVKTRLN